jgi:hypothetical protein
MWHFQENNDIPEKVCSVLIYWFFSFRFSSSHWYYSRLQTTGLELRWRLWNVLPFGQWLQPSRDESYSTLFIGQHRYGRHQTLSNMNRDSSSSDWLRAGSLGFYCRQVYAFFLFVTAFSDTPSLLFSGQNGQGMKLTIHFHVVPRLRARGALVCTSINLDHHTLVLKRGQKFTILRSIGSTELFTLFQNNCFEIYILILCYKWTKSYSMPMTWLQSRYSLCCYARMLYCLYSCGYFYDIWRCERMKLGDT